MPTSQEIEAKFWETLAEDRTVMLGLAGTDNAHLVPMTAQFENDRSPLWFFTSKDTELSRALDQGASRAVATFAAKGHDLFATMHGRLSADNDPAIIDKFWNRYVAAWFEGGKDDPKLALLRFDAERAEIWLDELSLIAGIKLMLGADPKEEYKDKVAEVGL